MARYIDADRLCKAFCSHCCDDEGRGKEYCEDLKNGGCFDLKLIKNAPTADVVEVVRCKDCEYYQRDLMWGHGYCYGQKRKEDWFCADGRRRDDG